jgi:hypothetical protein
MIIFLSHDKFFVSNIYFRSKKTMIEMWCRDSKNTLLITNNKIVFFCLN